MHSIFDYILHLLCILVDMFDHIILQIIFLILHIIFNCISHTLCTFNCILEHDVLPTTLHILHIESCSYFAYWETFTFFAYYCAYYLAYYHAYFLHIVVHIIHILHVTQHIFCCPPDSFSVHRHCCLVPHPRSLLLILPPPMATITTNVLHPWCHCRQPWESLLTLFKFACRRE